MAPTGARSLPVWLFALLLALLPGVAPLSPAQAAELTETSFTIKVNTFADEWSTDPATAPSSKCSLREALQATGSNSLGNQGCGAPSISNFESYSIDMPGGTYTLTRDEDMPNTGKKIVIDGKGAVTINGNSQAGRQRGIFIVAAGEFILIKMKLQYGWRGFGGAIWIKGGSATVRVTEVEFYRNLADNTFGNGDGGAVAVDVGSFICVKSKFIENTARRSGGAVSSGGAQVLLDRCEFLRNHAELNGGAYAAYGGSEVTHPIMRDVLFEQNWVYQTTVPAGWPGNYQFTDDQSGGGALYVAGSGFVELERVQFVKNYTDRSKGGGAIYNQGELRMVDTGIADNKAKPSDKVPETLGGAILNDSTLIIRRTSIHGNEARYGGAIMNRLSGDLYLVNSTVADNLAKSGGGVSNGYEFPFNGGTQALSGGDVNVYHSTLVRANDNATESVSVMNIGNGYYYMANSITDSLCTGQVHSHGGNVFKTFCSRISSDINIDHTLTDVVVENVSEIGLQGLAANGGVNLPKAQFLSVKVAGTSVAVDLGRNEWCTDPALVPLFLMDLDQLKGARLQGEKCDAGAVEVGSAQPIYYSQDPEGAGFFFPLTVFGKKFSSDHPFVMKNNGGGLFTWQISFPNNPGNAFAVADGVTTGSLGKGQSVSVPLTCTPSTLGWQDGLMIVTTDIPGKEKIEYPVSCKMTTDPNNPNSWRNQPPGPISAGQAPPGGQSQVKINVGNQGANPMNATINWKDVAGDTLQFTAGLGGLQAATLAAMPQADFTVPPSGTLEITVTCAPAGPGLFYNTLQITTNDPTDPQLDYDVSCEGAPNPDPERLGVGSTVTLLPYQMMGMALSPDGTQLLAGEWGGASVRIYNIGVNAGVPSFNKNFSTAGMTTTTGIRYTSDGKYVYYSSFDGDGVVAAKREANGDLTFVEKITTNSNYLCGVNPIKFCTRDAMGGARALDISPDDKHLYVSGINDDTLSVLTIDPATGGINYTQKITGTIDGQLLMNGPFGVLASEDGKNVYVAARDGDTVLTFTRNPENGRLTYLAHSKDGPEGATALDGATELAISPDGRFLYVAGQNDDAVQIFARNPADGYLTPAGTIAVGDAPYHLLTSNDAEGSRLVVVLYTGSAIKVYKRDYESGQLTPLEGQADLTPNQPVFLVSSADDRNVYATLFNGKGIQHLRSLRHTPIVQNVAPAAITVGSGDTTITVNGMRFSNASVVYFNGAPLATTFVSDRRLEAIVPAAALANAVQTEVFVRTSPPGGGDSTAVQVQIAAADAAPVPSIVSVDPPAVNITGEPLSVTITGSGFTPESQALLNGAPVDTSYLNPTTLLVELSADQVTSVGPLAFSVVNGALEAAQATLQASVAATPIKFTVESVNSPTLPSISSVSPASLGAGSAEQWITVRGYNFANSENGSSVALWNGSARETVVVDENTLQFLVSGADLAAAGTAQIAVATPGTGESDRSDYNVLPAGQNPIAVVEAVFGEVGSEAQIAVSGNNFVDGAEVIVNGSSRTATFVSQYLLTVPVSLSDLRQGGLIQVANPNTGLSNSIILAPQDMVLLPMIRK
jgi:CSLREA domain-containing protein